MVGVEDVFDDGFGTFSVTSETVVCVFVVKDQRLKRAPGGSLGIPRYDIKTCSRKGISQDRRFNGRVKHNRFPCGFASRIRRHDSIDSPPGTGSQMF